MDWYKLFEHVTPSLLTGGTIVIGAYLGYFKKKFETYGDIAGKLEKVPQLSEIEGAIANAKNSSEFEYHKKKTDLDKISELSLKAIEVSEASSFFLISMNQKHIELAEKINITCFDEYADINVYSQLGFDNILKNHMELQKLRTIHKLYLSKYNCAQFDDAFREWKNVVIDLNLVLNNQIGEISKALHESRDELEFKNRYEAITKTRYYGNLQDVTKRMIALIDSIDSLANKISE